MLEAEVGVGVGTLEPREVGAPETVAAKAVMAAAEEEKKEVTAAKAQKGLEAEMVEVEKEETARAAKAMALQPQHKEWPEAEHRSVHP